MKVGILSDSHDNLDNIRKAVKTFIEAEVETVIHAGDFCSPFFFRIVGDLKAVCSKMYAVFGNNDGDRLLLSQKGAGFCEFKDVVYKLDIDGKKIVIMHYPDVAVSLYRSGDFDLVIFGHTHRLVLEEEKSILLNPGACSGYLADKATVALLDTQEMKIQIVNL